MKKSFKVLCIMLVVFMMSGCVKLNVDMSIHKDKSMDITVIEAVSNALMQNSNEKMFEESELKEIEDDGFTVENYSDGSMTGYKFTKRISNIDDVSTDKSFTGNIENIVSGKDSSSDIFSVKKGFFKNTYTVKLKEDVKDSFNEGFEEGLTSDDDYYSDYDDSYSYDDSYTYDDSYYDDYTSDSSLASNTDYASLMTNMDLKFTINLPYKAISSNATSVNNDGKQLTWNLINFNEDNIEFEFELYNMKNIYITIGIAAIIIIIIIILIVKKRKPKAPVATPVPVNDQVVVNNQTVPVTPVVNDSPVPTPMNTDMVAQTPVEPVQDNSAQTPVEPQSNETPVQTTNEPENITPTEPKTLDVQSETNDNSNENLINTESTETPNIFNANPNSENK